MTLSQLKYPAYIILGLEHSTLAEGCEKELLPHLKSFGFRFEKTSSSGTYVCMNVRQRILLQNYEQLQNLLINFEYTTVSYGHNDTVFIDICHPLINRDFTACASIKSCGL